MKSAICIRLLFLAVLSAFTTEKNFAQDNATAHSSPILPLYYEIKDALVAGNAAAASVKATAFISAVTLSETGLINDEITNALLKDAGIIPQTKDVSKQRASFSILSSDMYTLAKAVKLTEEPVYYAYCPMKKAHWLSSSAAIKNPYFGNAMLTCGRVEDLITAEKSR